MKIVISGYYGFDNSGDDALLMSIIDNLKKNDEKAEITVLSKNPQQAGNLLAADFFFLYYAALHGNLLICHLRLHKGGNHLMQRRTRYAHKQFARCNKITDICSCTS